ncbi:MAG: radical SAM protein, partial [Burkholderiaceae bacterium]
MEGYPVMNFLDLTRSELEQVCAEHSQPKFRALQLTKWVHNKGVLDFSKMTDIQSSFRDYLSRKVNVHVPKIIQSTKSADGSEKWLFKLKSGEVIESVIIPEDGRITACVSSQVGCAVDCSFCATGHQGFSRNLSLGEMLGQVWAINYLSNVGRVTNVVLMGMGEPLLNYSNLKEFLKYLLLDEAYGLSRRKVTVSTSGTVDTTTVGSYTLTYTSTDASGNSGTATITENHLD